jgi:3-deoxy-manno-octulosonate cytidylyltransferase (CMP-KDO synthetase)
MIEFENTVIVITAHMAGSHLPGRPMLDVNGRPLIIRAWAQATASNIGHVLVAAGDNNIAEAVRSAGGEALVAPKHLSAESDQVAAVLALRDPARKFRHVMNLPCHLPAIEPLSLRRCLAGLMNKDVDIATLAVASGSARTGAVRVLAPLEGEREVAYVRDLFEADEAQTTSAGFDLIGVYAYRREALEQFASLSPALREKGAGLEMRRALHHGMKLAAVKIDTAPLSVDTPETLEALRRLLKA